MKVQLVTNSIIPNLNSGLVPIDPIGPKKMSYFAWVKPYKVGHFLGDTVYISTFSFWSLHFVDLSKSAVRFSVNGRVQSSPLADSRWKLNYLDPGEMLMLLMVKWTFTGEDLFVGMIFRFPHSWAGGTWAFSLGLTIVDCCNTIQPLCELHKEKSCRIISTQLQQQYALTTDTKY